MSAYFKDKVIWVTGASSGIGAALVMELAKESNARIILSSRQEEALYQIAGKAGLDAGRFLVLPLDLMNYQELPAAAARAVGQFGRIDILINNAGLSQRSLAIETSIEVDKRLMDINFIGTVALTKAVLPYMIENGGGQLVTITSLMGVFGAPMRSGYAAAKHALHGFFDSLRAELYKKKISITLICPGFIQTDISLHALTGKGTQQGTMDDATQNGMPATVFAKRMLRAVAKQKRQRCIGGKELTGVFLKRFFPALLARVVRSAKVV